MKPPSIFAPLRKYNKWLTLFGFIVFPLILEWGLARTLPPKFYRNDAKYADLPDTKVIECVSKEVSSLDFINSGDDWKNA